MAQLEVGVSASIPTSRPKQDLTVCIQHMWPNQQWLCKSISNVASPLSLIITAVENVTQASIAWGCWSGHDQ